VENVVDMDLIIEVSWSAIHLCSGWNWALGLKEYASSLASGIPRHIRARMFFPKRHG